MWFFFWIIIMLGLVVTTTVVAMREKKARTAAIKKMSPKPLDGGSASPIPTADDGFGQQDPLAGFDGSGTEAFDDAAFK